MRLRRLDIQGFKSFPDKTSLTFERPITAVVGPNGSGKSNIADAVRWVLGEQSTKALRGGKMEDVIFSGTQSRKSVGFAHVQLVVDNSDGRLDGQPEEVTISRRLYRSGESEYRLNGVMVRLKDIHELFMDTGLGRDGYAIIGQGRIAEIVSAKSQSRREIFEEAAGISKFRYRKEEAERKLNQAEENLVRLRDILDELEARVGPLKEQSEKAKEFLLLSDEKKTLEISLWMSSLSILRGQISAQGDKVFLCKNRYEAMENESADREREIEAVYRQIQSLGVEVEEKRAGISLLEERMAASASSSAVLQNDIRHNEQSIEQLAVELESLSLSSDELAARLAERESELSEQREEHASLSGKVEAAAQRLEEQRDCVARVSGELDELQIRRESASLAIQDAMLQQASSETMLQESLARLSDLRERSGAQDAAVTELRQGIEECKTLRAEEEEKLGGLRNSLSGYALKQESRKKSIGELSDEIDKHLDDARDLRRKAGLLEDLEKNMEGFAGSVKYILDNARRGTVKGIIGPVSSLVSTDEKYILAVETALGAAMQNVVVEDESTAKRAIRMLQESRSGRATFLPLDTVKGSKPPDLTAVRRQEGFVGIASDLVQIDARYRKIAEQLLGRVCVAEDLDCAGRIAKASGYSLRVVTLDGQVVNAGGSFTGGSSAKGTGVLGRRREIVNLKQRAEVSEAKAAKLEPRRKSMTEELSALAAAVSGIEGELRTAQEEVVRLTATEAQLEKNLEAAIYNRGLAEKELEKLSARLEGLRDQEVTAKSLMEELRARLNELDEQVQATQIRRDSLVIGAEAASAALAEQRLAQLNAVKDMERLEQELERAKAAMETAGERAEELRDRKSGLERENADIRAKLAGLAEEAESRVKEKEELQGRITDLIARRNEKEANITALHAAERELSGRREQVSRELATLEARQSSLQGDYDQIIAKLWDEYELTRSQAAQIAQELPSKDKAQRRLGELRTKIRNLGTVNVAAIEEYAQVSERYEFLRAQVADVEKSKATLTRLIGGLTEEMRALFEENFQKIATHFGKIFVQLFGGGRAELTLTESEDVLDAGVEIFVQPPGKIIKNLSLLSGGEQAFVAIAIYFAILRVRPSPFCVLDEIEAALDDVNVVKFATYLRRMSGNTQFIAITHRRGTMEEADTLYGVTMQEEGISKLLELQIAEVEEKLGMS